jgi:hypothetical protein
MYIKKFDLLRIDWFSIFLMNAFRIQRCDQKLEKYKKVEIN